MAGYIGPNNRRYERPRRWWHFGVLTAAMSGVLGIWNWLRSRQRLKSDR